MKNGKGEERGGFEKVLKSGGLWQNDVNPGEKNSGLLK